MASAFAAAHIFFTAGFFFPLRHLDTLRRWIREDRKVRKQPAPKRDRRTTAEQIRKLILKLAKANGWGYTRILDELRKLNIRCVCRNTVKNILRENGIETGPKRGLGTWDECKRPVRHIFCRRVA